MRTVRFGAALVASTVLALAGCGGSGDSTSSGPAPISDGAYAYLASSAGGGAQAATLTIAGGTLTLTGDAGPVTATIGEPATEAVLCPPSGKGQPAEVGAALTVGSVSLASPAIFGDCGQTTPKRVTLVDLDSYDEAGGPLKFTRWMEFCDTSDPDCPEPTN
jgi:hypothetical protein